MGIFKKFFGKKEADISNLAFLARKKELENKGLVFMKTSPFGNPLFVRYFVQEANNINIPIEGISDSKKEQLELEIMQGMLEGKSTDEISRKTNNIISDF